MTVAQSAGVFTGLGTDETTGVTITNTSTTTSSEVDMLGGTTAEGWMHVYLKYTSSAAAGSIDVSVIYSRITGQAYPDQGVVVGSYVPIIGTQQIYVGMFQLGRYMKASVKNNGVGASITNVLLGYEKFLES